MGTEIKLTTTERRYLWIARAFAMLTIASICCNVILLFLLLRFASPTQPFFVEVGEREDQTLKVTHFDSMSADVNELVRHLTEKLIREYIIYRHAIVSDPIEMERRWGVDGRVFHLSNADVWEEFLKENNDYFLKSRKFKSGLSRTVKVLEVDNADDNTINKSRGEKKWKIEVLFSEIKDGESLGDTAYTIFMKTQYTRDLDRTVSDEQKKQDRTVVHKKRLNNPLGFQVIEYKKNIKLTGS